MKDLIETLVIPPVGLVLLILLGLALRGRWHRLGRRVTWASLILLILFGMPAFSFALLEGLEANLPTASPADDPPQAIVVLGAEIIQAPDQELGSLPGPLTLDRLRTAAELHRRTGLPILVAGGTTLRNTAPLAVVMARSLTEDFGTPPKWVELQSEDTLENARFSAAILRPLGITSVYVVTHAWHMRRTVVAFQGTGLTVTVAPVSRVHLLLGLEPNDLLPRTAGWQAGFYAVHEWVGYAWYSLRRSWH
jgi:uncharacterized SAM-binding protein YcdF (DUF218 family)